MNQTPCLHGGAFWDGIKGDLRTLMNCEMVAQAAVRDVADNARIVDALTRAATGYLPA